MNNFIHAPLQELADQVRFAPPARRREQIGKAGELLAEIDSAKRYPYQFVCFRVTGYRSDAHASLVVPGSELENDLRLLIDHLERSLPPLPVEQVGEPMLTLDEISRKFNVSTKTITRWRTRGLVGRRVIRNGRRQLGFPKSIVEHFAEAHPERVARGSRFSRISEEEKAEILCWARRLARAGGSLTEVSKRVARKFGRSVEAVRYTIKNHDRTNPGTALYPAAPGPLNGAIKQKIVTSYTEGVPVSKLAKEYGRTRTSMYRVINEARAEQLLAEPLDYMHSEEFDIADIEDTILAEMPDRDKFEAERLTKTAPKDVPPEFAPLYQVPLLSKPQEQHLFRKMNYLKFKFNKLRESINPAKATSEELRQIEELHRQVREVKDLLTHCNMRLVVSIAKQHAGTSDNIFELVSDGNVSLIRAIEKFDYYRGNKFSTYASWAIMKNFARSIPTDKTYKERYLTGHEELFEARADNRGNEAEIMQQAEQAKARVNRLLQDLDPRTRDVIKMRAGLDGNEEMTLEQIGQHFGITKERVRQINVRGMKQLREKALAEGSDILL